MRRCSDISKVKWVRGVAASSHESEGRALLVSGHTGAAGSSTELLSERAGKISGEVARSWHLFMGAVQVLARTVAFQGGV
jgi:hypothetical protein